MTGIAESFATSMVEGVVDTLVENLSSIISEELGLLLGVRRDIQYIKDELNMMKAFLVSAEQKQESDPTARAWVQQVRELAYDVEDCIEEFALHLSKTRKNNFLGYLRHRSSSLLSLGARHRIATGIQYIKSRVEDLSDRRSRYGLNETAQGSTSSFSAQHDLRQAALFVEESQLVGFDKSRDVLIEWLLEETSPPLRRVISVVGMGGLGKTTLTRKVYESPRVTGGHFRCRAWITVSQPFDNKGFLRDLSQKLFPESHRETDNEDQLMEKISRHLQDKRYVIVLDDVWTVDAWNRIDIVLPYNNNGSRIMVTTRMETVANTCSSVQNHEHVYKLPPLSPEQSWDLFCRRVFDGTDHRCPPELEELSKDILKKCDGLPLAIMTIGGLLASKPNKTREEWENMLNRLGSELESNPSLDGMKRILTLSYDDLPYHLKHCFLYLSIFPEDYEISCKRLQRLWMAEGFVKRQRGMMTEDVAESYFNEFISRSMILPSEISDMGKVKTFRVHDIMLEVIVSKSIEENYVCLLKAEQDIAMPEGVTRRLSIHPGCSIQLEHMNLMSSFLSHVRSLIIFGEGRHSFVSPRLSLLRVLDLQDCRILRNDHMKKICKLRHLKYLSLRGLKYIDMLPKSLGKLQNLETLDLRYIKIEKIPTGVVKLQQLRYLLVTYSKIPQGIGSLKSLQTMETVDVGCKGVVKELGKLTQLRKLGVANLRQDHGKDFCASLDNLSSCLRSLSVQFHHDNLSNITIWNSLSSPPPLLRSLTLIGHLGELPSWVGSLNNMVKIVLYDTELRDDAIQVLENLPNLILLRFKLDSYIGEQLCFGGEGRFPSLKVLSLHNLRELKSVRFEGAMVKLEKVSIIDCRLISGEGGIAGIEHLPSLKDIELNRMPVSILEMMRRAAEAHPNHPKVTVL